MNRRSLVALLGVLVILLTLNLAAKQPKDEAKPMVTVAKRCVGVTSQVVPGQGMYVVRAFEDGTTEAMALAPVSLDRLKTDRWRAIPEPVGTAVRGESLPR